MVYRGTAELIGESGFPPSCTERPMTLLALAISAVIFPAGQGLSTDYGRERSLRIVSEAKLELETTAFEMTVDGEPADRKGGGPGDMAFEASRRTVLVDQILSGEGARPHKVRRTFETLAEKSALFFGEEARDDEREGPLQGLVLELTQDGEGAPKVEVVQGNAPEDPALLEGHALFLALDALLPSSEVAVDSSWELDDGSVKRALALALDPLLFPERKPEEGERGPGLRGSGMRGGSPMRYLANVQWKGKATLIETGADKEGGEPCARIQIELEGTGDLPESPWRRGPERGFRFEPGGSALPATAEGTVDVRLAGSLLVSTVRRIPVSLELTGEMTTENEFERERDGRMFSMHHTQSGPVSFAVTVEEP